MAQSDGRLDVVVLSCGDLGIAVANRLRALDRVGRITLVTAPWRSPARTLPAKIRHVLRTQGLRGLFAVVWSRLTRAHGASSPDGDREPVAALESAIAHQRYDDFHDPACIEAIRGLGADLGVIAGTYILRETVFGVPRLGSINLHSGKVPRYRGAAPGFWELYNGESEVGITIHRAASAVDAGEVLLQETFPLDDAPAGDPVAYIERYRRDVLRPNGVRLVAEAVDQLSRGTVRAREQEHMHATTYRSPDRRAILELRRRVRMRRANNGTTA